MNKAAIQQHIGKQVQLQEQEWEIFFAHFEYRSLARNELLCVAGDELVHFVLVESGCLMTYFTDREGHIHVMQFGTDMWWTGDLEAFTRGTGSRYSIKALMPSEVWLITRTGFEALVRRLPQLERYFRSLFQNALIAHQKRIIRNISYTAEEKYAEFIRTYPQVWQLVPQKYIASFMGITPEFLSKLRRQLLERERS